jgi:hypothetical protein
VGFVYALKTERTFGFTPRFSARTSFMVCVCVEQTLSYCAFSTLLHIFIPWSMTTHA